MKKQANQKAEPVNTGNPNMDKPKRKNNWNGNRNRWIKGEGF